MKVAVHADPACHAVPGGVGVYVRRLVDQLLADPGDDRFSLILSRFAEPPPTWLTTPMVRPRLAFGPLYASWNSLQRPGIGEGFDVVHATGLAIPPAPGARLVSTVHDLTVEQMPEVVPAPWRRIYRRGLKRALDESRIICTLCDAIRRELISSHGLEPGRVVVTPVAPNVTPDSPSDPSVIDRLGLEGKFLLSVGTIEPRKNQVRLLKAFVAAGPALENHTLVLAGIPGWGQEEVEAAIEDLRISHRVILTGKVTNLDLAALYSRADLFALPSLYEGFGIPLVEAMGFGVPCLAGDTPALTELAGDAALVAEPTDVDALAEGLAKLATDAALRERLSAASRAKAARYTWSETARLTRQAYRDAAG